MECKKTEVQMSYVFGMKFCLFNDKTFELTAIRANIVSGIMTSLTVTFLLKNKIALNRHL